MNYWPAELTNLSECHEPLFDLLEDVSKPARTAKISMVPTAAHHNRFSAAQHRLIIPITAFADRQVCQHRGGGMIYARYGSFCARGLSDYEKG